MNKNIPHVLEISLNKYQIHILFTSHTCETTQWMCHLPTPFFIFPISWALNEEMTWKMIPLSLFIRNVIWPYKWRTVFVMKIPKDDNKSPMSRAIDGASFMPQDVVVSSECQWCQCCLLYLYVEFINFYTFLSSACQYIEAQSSFSRKTFMRSFDSEKFIQLPCTKLFLFPSQVVNTWWRKRGEKQISYLQLWFLLWNTDKYNTDKKNKYKSTRMSITLGQSNREREKSSKAKDLCQISTQEKVWIMRQQKRQKWGKEKGKN